MRLVVALLVQSGAGQIEQIATTFGVDWPHLLAQIVSFGIVCALLYWLAYQPVLRMLDERRRQIAQGLENTEKINAALAGIEAQRQGVLTDARANATQLIAEAREAGAQLREREAQRAAATAEQIVLEARGAAARERTQMLEGLRRDVGRLVVQTTAAVTGKVLTPDDHQRLARETASRLTQFSPPGRVQ